MEDAFLITEISNDDNVDLLVNIFDGHGGTEVVNILTKSFIAAFKEAIGHCKSVALALVETYRVVDQMVMNSKVRFGGSTACTCFFTTERLEQVLYTAHVGDTRAVLCRAGAAIRLTSASDHKACDPAEWERIKQQDGAVFNERVSGMLAVSRAFGDDSMKKTPPKDDPDSLVMDHVVSAVPDVTSVVLDPERDAFVIVACDGLWDVVSDQEAVNLAIECLHVLRDKWKDNYGTFSTNFAAEMLATCLTEEALSRGTTDNVTCAIVFI